MAELGQRDDIETIARTIADRVIRGQRAENNREVKLYHRLKVLTVAGTAVASALASAGISNPVAALTGNSHQTAESALAAFKGWSFVLLLVGVVIFVALFVYHEVLKNKDLEKVANLSLGLHEAYTTLGAEFERVMDSVNEPIEQLGPVHEAALAMSVYWAHVMPRSADCRQEIAAYGDDVINRNYRRWSSEVPVRRRR